MTNNGNDIIICTDAELFISFHIYNIYNIIYISIYMLCYIIYKYKFTESVMIMYSRLKKAAKEAVVGALDEQGVNSYWANKKITIILSD